MELFKRARHMVNIKFFNKINKPFKYLKYNIDIQSPTQHVLRMCIKTPHEAFKIPRELEWTRELVALCHKNQMKKGFYQSYCYITIRHGDVISETDDEWHTDGFSTIISHIPEQNYVISNRYPTEYVLGKIKIPKRFNTRSFNIHTFIQAVMSSWSCYRIYTMEPHRIYVIDPYVIHRRPPESKGKHRTFVRVSFVPIEIYDDNCTRNPLMKEKLYNRVGMDTRCNLKEYKEFK